jgi:hypothetical protein
MTIKNNIFCKREKRKREKKTQRVLAAAAKVSKKRVEGGIGNQFLNAVSCRE